MSITFYYASQSSATPVAWALAELGVQHEAVKFDLSAKDQKKPEFLALNPNGKVPTLVVDGTPMFEALAILQWLGDRFGVDKQLWPAMNDPARLQALSWTTWSYVSFASVMGRSFLASNPSFGTPNAKQVEFSRSEIAGLLTVLDGRLAQKAFLLSERFSFADLIVSAVIGWAQSTGVTLAAHARVQQWLARCVDRPSYRSAR